MSKRLNHVNSVTINISLPKEFIERIDAQARREQRNRSDMLRVMAEKYLAVKSSECYVPEES